MPRRKWTIGSIVAVALIGAGAFVALRHHRDAEFSPAVLPAAGDRAFDTLESDVVVRDTTAVERADRLPHAYWLRLRENLRYTPLLFAGLQLRR